MDVHIQIIWRHIYKYICTYGCTWFVDILKYTIISINVFHIYIYIYIYIHIFVLEKYFGKYFLFYSVPYKKGTTKKKIKDFRDYGKERLWETRSISFKLFLEENIMSTLNIYVCML